MKYSNFISIIFSENVSKTVVLNFFLVRFVKFGMVSVKQSFFFRHYGCETSCGSDSYI